MLVTCKVFQRDFQIINARHLANHSLTKEEYLNLYDLSLDQLVTKELRLRSITRKDSVPLYKDELLDVCKADGRR